MPETSLTVPPVRLRSAPPSDPPYDDELPADLWWSATAGQPLLDLPPPADRRPPAGPTDPGASAPVSARAPVAGASPGPAGHRQPRPAAGRRADATGMSTSTTAPTTAGPPADPTGPTTTGLPASIAGVPTSAAGPPTGTAGVPTSTAGLSGRAQRVMPAASPTTTTAAVRFINTCLEIFNGYRPVTHFRSLASPLEAGEVVAEMTQALRRLRHAARRSTSRRDGLIKLRRMRTCQPLPGVAEVAVVIGLGGNAARDQPAWALAYRLEQRHGRWLCTTARML